MRISRLCRLASSSLFYHLGSITQVLVWKAGERPSQLEKAKPVHCCKYSVILWKILFFGRATKLQWFYNTTSPRQGNSRRTAENSNQISFFPHDACKYRLAIDQKVVPMWCSILHQSTNLALNCIPQLSYCRSNYSKRSPRSPNNQSMNCLVHLIDSWSGWQL